MATVLIVDDHEMVRAGIAHAIDAEPDLEVVGEAASCRQALQRVASLRPDVAILDVHLPDGSGIDVCRAITQQHPTVACLILTAFDDDDAVLAAVLANAAGYLLKSVRRAELIDAVRQVAKGRTLLGARVSARVQQSMRVPDDGDARFAALSLRERQTLALIADGLTNRQIGERLHIAEKTVKNYVSTMLDKLGFDHRTQAAIFEITRTSGRR